MLIERSQIPCREAFLISMHRLVTGMEHSQSVQLRRGVDCRVLFDARGLFSCIEGGRTAEWIGGTWALTLFCDVRSRQPSIHSCPSHFQIPILSASVMQSKGHEVLHKFAECFNNYIPLSTSLPWSTVSHEMQTLQGTLQMNMHCTARPNGRVQITSTPCELPSDSETAFLDYVVRPIQDMKRQAESTPKVKNPKKSRTASADESISQPSNPAPAILSIFDQMQYKPVVSEQQSNDQEPLPLEPPGTSSHRSSHILAAPRAEDVTWESLFEEDDPESAPVETSFSSRLHKSRATNRKKHPVGNHPFCQTLLAVLAMKTLDWC